MIEVVNIILYHIKHNTQFLIYKNNMYSKLIQQDLPLTELNLAYHSITKYDM